MKDKEDRSTQLYERFVTLFRNNRKGPAPLLQQQIDRMKQVESILWPSPTIHFLLNFRTLRYEFISHKEGTVFGYPVADFYRHGVREYFEMLHFADAEMLVNEVFPDLKKESSAYPAGEASHLDFEYNYRIVRRDGETINVLEQSRVLETDEGGWPILGMGRLIQSEARTHHHTIEAAIRLQQDENISKTVFQQSYPPTMLMTAGLTAREMEILKELINGRTSREIANALFISVNTVDTHRRNLLRKMGKKSTQEMVSHVIKSGLWPSYLSTS